MRSLEYVIKCFGEEFFYSWTNYIDYGNQLFVFQQCHVAQVTIISVLSFHYIYRNMP